MALAYRGHFALINNPTMNAKGINTSAPLVFTNTLLEIIDRFEAAARAAQAEPEPTTPSSDAPDGTSETEEG